MKENNLRTTYHSYCFDIRKPDEKLAYKELKEKLKAQGLECFETHGGGSHVQPELNGKVVELETEHLFENQWNTGPVEGVSELGLRVFDWAQDYNSSIGAPSGIKRGHYLEQTDAMKEVRRNTLKCGYCGKQEPSAKGFVFCPHCLDSEYLTVGHLKLTRMRPIDQLREEFPPLTEAERDYLMPLYKEAQIHGSSERGRARIAKKRKDVVEKAAKDIQNATTERDGFLWLLDQGIKVDNVIYYDHTEKFCFGWLRELGPELMSSLLDVLVEFPFDYEIKGYKPEEVTK